MKRVTKSHIPAINVPARIQNPNKNDVARTSKADVRRGRPIGFKDKNPRKRKIEKVDMNASAPEKVHNNNNDVIVGKYALEKEHDNENETSENKIENENDFEISINYVCTGKLWNWKSKDIDDIFAFSIACEIMNEIDDPDPRSVIECQHRPDWSKWKDAIDIELNLLRKRKVFGPIIEIPMRVKPVEYKWVFVRKRNEKNEIVRYKARLVAQGFSQKHGIDYEVTYSPVMDSITFRYLIGLSVSYKVDMHLMDFVTTYLYGSLDSHIYMKISEGFKMLEKEKPREMYAIKLQKITIWVKSEITCYA
ncbi:hypothetical protein LIER_05156 [Lithospermum erythrorhizon]|uniref:Reverse transcriptase Ty1/copia-type domain-containing protein n=1 Tax=Lithospermum erythrorhizon TaxID=34254 RepID=A0AAV3NZF9_LITER